MGDVRAVASGAAFQGLAKVDVELGRVICARRAGGVYGPSRTRANVKSPARPGWSVSQFGKANRRTILRRSSHRYRFRWHHLPHECSDKNFLTHPNMLLLNNILKQTVMRDGLNSTEKRTAIPWFRL